MMDAGSCQRRDIIKAALIAAERTIPRRAVSRWTFPFRIVTARSTRLTPGKWKALLKEKRAFPGQAAAPGSEKSLRRKPIVWRRGAGVPSSEADARPAPRSAAPSMAATNPSDAIQRSASSDHFSSRGRPRKVENDLFFPGACPVSRYASIPLGTACSKPAGKGRSGTPPAQSRIVIMAESDDDAAKSEQSDGVFSPIPVLMMLGGGFATFAMALGVYRLLQAHGGL